MSILGLCAHSEDLTEIIHIGVQTSLNYSTVTSELCSWGGVSEDSDVSQLCLSLKLSPFFRCSVRVVLRTLTLADILNTFSESTFVYKLWNGIQGQY